MKGLRYAIKTVCRSEPCCCQKGEQQVAGTRRKDNKGRVLRSGESQRKDRTYDYRYTDAFGKRRSVYAGTLQELREKEAEIERLKAMIMKVNVLEEYK